ncbi:MAG: hypothetical protein PHG41_04815 [Actinomycetota bacterium]|nr:hypothetical protein [Actinomycetota bacterium]
MDLQLSYEGKYFQLISVGKSAVTILRSKVSTLTTRRIGTKAEYSGKV